MQHKILVICKEPALLPELNRYVGELVEQLIQEGQLVTAETKNGRGIRTATGAELRQREEPLPGQQQMTL